MAFAGLFQEEVEGKVLSWDAKSFLDAVRNGATTEQALEHAGVNGAQLVVWKTHLRFRKEFKIAQRGEGIPRCWTAAELYASPDPNAPPPPGSLEADYGRRLPLDWTSGAGPNSPEYGRPWR